ncbi:hypothetical protein, partial [Mesorhizobium sp. L48C026A00]|uniref:hypothetical protein n=1 Tax=Mesorhizobium sp. L48C026A00 TaxID=1287182 RepID=UPI001AEBD5FB
FRQEALSLKVVHCEFLDIGSDHAPVCLWVLGTESHHRRYRPTKRCQRYGGTRVIELTETEKRFLKRVDTITHVPWSNKVTAADAKGKPMRIGRATFVRLRDDGIIIRSTSDLTSNTYVINPAPVTPQVEEVQEAS